MDKQQNKNLGQEQEFEIFMESGPESPQDQYFNNVVMALQQIILDEQFELVQNGFMKQHCSTFEETQQNKMQYLAVYKQYHERMEKYLQQKLSQKIQGFMMQRFLELLKTRSDQIDEQILEMLTSLSDFQTFKQLILDYKVSMEEEQRLQVLTLKSNKIPQSKTVKGSNNIFAKQQSYPLKTIDDPLMNLKKKASKTMTQKKEKTQEELLTPDLVLTIKPIKKQ